MSNFANLSIADLNFLLQVEKQGVLLKAGEILNMSPSTSSRTFSRIKTYFDTPIFRLEKGKWIATEYFQAIRPNVISIVEAAEKLNKTKFRPSECTMTFGLSCMMTEVEHIIGGVLPMMIKEAPHSRLDLRKSDDEFKAVMDGLADFAIVTAVNLPSEVHFLRLYRLDRVVLVRKDHPLTRLGRDPTTKDLMDYDRVTILSGRARSWTGPDQSVFPREHYMEHTRFSTTRFHAAWEAMEHTDLISVCGWRAAEIAMRGHKLVALPLPREIKKGHVWNVLIWSEAKHKSEPHIWLRGLFSRWAEQEARRVIELAKQGKGPPKFSARTKLKD